MAASPSKYNYHSIYQLKDTKLKLTDNFVPFSQNRKTSMPEWDFSVVIQESSQSKIPGINFRRVFTTASLWSCPLKLDHMRQQQCFQSTEPCWAPGCCSACTGAGMSPLPASPALRHSWALCPCWAPSSHCSIPNRFYSTSNHPCTLLSKYYNIIAVKHS